MHALRKLAQLSVVSKPSGKTWAEEMLAKKWGP